MCEKYGSGAGSDLPPKEAAKKKKRESQLMGRAGRAVGGPQAGRIRLAHPAKTFEHAGGPHRLYRSIDWSRPQLAQINWFLIEQLTIFRISNRSIHHKLIDSLIFDWAIDDISNRSMSWRVKFFSELFLRHSRNFGEKNEQGGFHFIFRSKFLWSKLPHKRVAPENEISEQNPYNSLNFIILTIYE